MERKIRIEVDPQTGDMSYTPALLRLRRDKAGAGKAHPKEQVVTWFSESGNFTLVFHDQTPFHTTHIQGVKGKPVTERLNPEAAPGSYRYIVAMAAGDQVFVDHHCPVIIVD